MSLPGLYLDEDVQASALITALRSRSIDVLTTTEAGMSNSPDEEQLRFATSRRRVLVTCNVADFARLHAEWRAAGSEHAGIVLVHQQKWGPGELARRLIRLLLATPKQDMVNKIAFLSSAAGD